MKKMFVVLLAAFLLLACQPTPEHEIIENKGEKKDWQTEAQPLPDEAPTPVGEQTVPDRDYERQESPLYERLHAPKQWSMENSEYGFPIVASDCPVVLPDIAAVPAIEAERRSFTQADIDAVAALMFPADTVWYPEVLWTKEDVAITLKEIMDEAAQADSSKQQYYEDKLAMHRKRYEEAPYAADVVPTTLEINPCQEDYRTENGKLYDGVKVETRVDGAHWRLIARTDQNDPHGTFIEASRADLWTDLRQPLDTPYGVQMSRAEAIEKATEVAKTLAGSEYSVCYCAPIIAHADQSGEIAVFPDRYSQWGLVLMRTFNGCPTAYAAEEIGGDMDSTVTAPVHYERMELHIDDEGVSYLRWSTPMTVTGVVQSDAQLLSFDEAAGKAMQHIAARWKYTVENDRKNGKDLTVYINRVTLGLWRINKKNGGWYYVPVYHFFSDGIAGDWADYVNDNPYTADALGLGSGATIRELFLRAMEKEEGRWLVSGLCRTFGGEYWGSVTVNALDGTIIDKDKGY